MHGRPLDVWALGITFYCMIYGDVPFGGTYDSKDMGDGIINEE